MFLYFNGHISLILLNIIQSATPSLQIVQPFPSTSKTGIQKSIDLSSKIKSGIFR